jgi:hypothetical protein
MLCHPHGIMACAFAVLSAGDRAWNARRRRAFGAPHFLAAVTWPLGDWWT